MKRTIDGNATLEEQRRTLRFAELASFKKLDNYEMGDIGELNVASFIDTEIGEKVPELVILEVPESRTPAEIISSPFAAGKRLIFDSTVFIEGKETKIVALR
jgi:hypothetical protein